MADKNLDDILDGLSARFHQSLSETAVPGQLWHYTDVGGLVGILGSGKLWATSARSMEDIAEIRYGNDLVRQAAVALLPELAINRLLYDCDATLFCSEDDMFMCCFTTEADAPRQWERDPRGGAIVFQHGQLANLVRGQLQGSGLVRVRYDADRVRRQAGAFLKEVIEVATPLAVNDDDIKLIAQYMMDIGVFAFYTKQERYDWEMEWRITKRLGLGCPPIIDHPNRHLEVELQRDARHPIVEVWLGPECSSADEADIRRLAAPWGVAVARSNRSAKQ
ncbi:MAG: hypothetical protein DYH12_14030 [Sorangiineae bacterium PRO1]|nr:hypothetical protein [Sorangiineae bacterium PRO1]